jgi:hypothetical protein
LLSIPTRIVHLPDLADGEDVSDFLDRGGTREQILMHTKMTKLITVAEVPAAGAASRSRSRNGHHRRHDALS